MTIPKQIAVIERTPFSVIEAGVVSYGPHGAHEVPFRRETPLEPITDETVVAVTGLGADLASLQLESSTLASLGHTVLSVGHSHHALNRPIKRNAEDTEAIIEAFVPNGGVNLTGLSKGASVVLLVSKQMPEAIGSINLVAPAMMSRIRPERFPLFVFETAREIGANDYRSVMIDCIETMSIRTGTTLAEAAKLVMGMVHKRVKALDEHEIPIHLLGMSRDCFFSPKDLRGAARKLGISYTQFSSGTAGHGALAYDRRVSEAIHDNIVRPHARPETGNLKIAS